ncbi:MAG: amino acid ABC transporter permease [Chromatiaceae bacterium]|nr:amino acid ABC transporter permease [Gammaproteobacteria bacterium]MCP5316564.1 amino acid ABC transporter permease [Chromatiaceae bacterium]MCP5429717.1 amino acid ABC transporter permease [Chromatiaceae bacterium]MCP5434129.1 amino acid ABC transporter permease [Chromatiaceae bacterium]HPQ24380.1 amino acid ABC transporter permease [Gammaproteobacteria bacterium]
MATEHYSQDSTGKVPLWRQPTFRAIVFQVLLVLCILAFGNFLLSNTLQNMEQRGITTGFGFLDNAAGFGILQSLIPYDETYTYGRTFVVGLLNTLLVAALGIFFATFLGFFIGVARLSHNWLVARLATVYIETFRNIPLLLQIMFWYFAVLRPLPLPRQSLSIGDAVFLNNRGLFVPRPIAEDGFGLVVAALLLAIVGAVVLARWARKRQEASGQQFPTGLSAFALIVGLPLLTYWVSGSPLHWDNPVLGGFNFRGGLEVIPELAALVLALSIYTAAFIAEAVRSGIQSVSHGQTEAAYALGLRPRVTLKLVIIPQAMRVIIPQLTSQYLNLTKNSSLATAIGYPDLVNVFAGTTLNQTGQAVEVIAMTMGVYLLISLVISLFMNWYNKRNQLVER